MSLKAFQRYFDPAGVSASEQVPIPRDLSLCVVIPAYQEPELQTTLDSLARCKPTGASVEVHVVLNHPAEASSEVMQYHAEQVRELEVWERENPEKPFSLHVLGPFALRGKEAGVGMARKIGMDRAACRLWLAGNPAGPVASLDADATVTSNYLIALDRFFEKRPDRVGCSLRFEHRWQGLPEAYARAIYDYELHLRYYRQALVWCGHPMAYHTVGSSFAVRAATYVAEGGMNRKQAGEDFYFLQKVIRLGRFADLNTACVYPASRISTRVPFGTGRAMLEALEKERPQLTYAWDSFQVLRAFVEDRKSWFEDPVRVKRHPEVVACFGESSLQTRWSEWNQHSKDFAGWEKRFWQWFHLFHAMRLLHFLRDHSFPQAPVQQEAGKLLQAYERPEPTDLLLAYRELDRINKPGVNPGLP